VAPAGLRECRAPEPLQVAIVPSLASLESAPPAIVDQPYRSPNRRQSEVGIVNPQQQAVLGP
jgi:hypothetical protein